MKDAPIVVLDEATAFADPENEQQIQKAFETLIRGKTVLMIAHRLSTIQNADCILVMEDGRIAEQGAKSILTKRAVTDCIQEELETIRDVKACGRQNVYREELEEKLKAMEKSSIHAELANGIFVCSAQAFLRISLATTVLTGVRLLLAGEMDFLFFLGFLFAAARLYDPLGMVLQNIAATFSAKLKIERMRSILEQPVQERAEQFEPSNYDIAFEHVTFSYHDGEGVLSDVSFTAKQGEVTALIGPSGGSKSTACKLAARFWDVNGGGLLWAARTFPPSIRKLC